MSLESANIVQLTETTSGSKAYPITLSDAIVGPLGEKAYNIMDAVYAGNWNDVITNGNYFDDSTVSGVTINGRPPSATDGSDNDYGDNCFISVVVTNDNIVQKTNYPGVSKHNPFKLVRATVTTTTIIKNYYRTGIITRTTNGDINTIDWSPWVGEVSGSSAGLSSQYYVTVGTSKQCDFIYDGADLSVAMNAAYTQLSAIVDSNNQGTIFIESGSYIITNSIIVKGYIDVVGASTAGVVLNRVGNSFVLFSFTSSISNIKFQNLSCFGDTTLYTGGTLFASSSGISVSNIFFDGVNFIDDHQIFNLYFDTGYVNFNECTFDARLYGGSGAYYFTAMSDLSIVSYSITNSNIKVIMEFRIVDSFYSNNNIFDSSYLSISYITLKSPRLVTIINNRFISPGVIGQTNCIAIQRYNSSAVSLELMTISGNQFGWMENQFGNIISLIHPILNGVVDVFNNVAICNNFFSYDSVSDDSNPYKKHIKLHDNYVDYTGYYLSIYDRNTVLISTVAEVKNNTFLLRYDNQNGISNAGQFYGVDMFEFLDNECSGFLITGLNAELCQYFKISNNKFKVRDVSYLSGIKFSVLNLITDAQISSPFHFRGCVIDNNLISVETTTFDGVITGINLDKPIMSSIYNNRIFNMDTGINIVGTSGDVARNLSITNNDVYRGLGSASDYSATQDTIKLNYVTQSTISNNNVYGKDIFQDSSTLSSNNSIYHNVYDTAISEHTLSSFGSVCMALPVAPTQNIVLASPTYVDIIPFSDTLSKQSITSAQYCLPEVNGIKIIGAGSYTISAQLFFRDDKYIFAYDAVCSIMLYNITQGKIASSVGGVSGIHSDNSNNTGGVLSIIQTLITETVDFNVNDVIGIQIMGTDGSFSGTFVDIIDATRSWMIIQRVSD